MGLQTMPLRFRVWDKENGRFFTMREAYPLIQLSKETAGSIEFSVQELSTLLSEVLYYDDSSQYIISQDTGLKDKNGKSIYTGDIIRFAGRIPMSAGMESITSIGYIRYEDGGLFVDEGGLDEIYPLYDVNGFADSIKVLGNIWQTPELLEEK